MQAELTNSIQIEELRKTFSVSKREGLRTIVGALDELARSVDARFAPSDGLRRRALS